MPSKARSPVIASPCISYNSLAVFVPSPV